MPLAPRGSPRGGQNHPEVLPKSLFLCVFSPSHFFLIFLIFFRFFLEKRAGARAPAPKSKIDVFSGLRSQTKFRSNFLNFCLPKASKMRSKKNTVSLAVFDDFFQGFPDHFWRQIRSTDPPKNTNNLFFGEKIHSPGLLGGLWGVQATF